MKLIASYQQYDPVHVVFRRQEIFRSQEPNRYRVRRAGAVDLCERYNDGTSVPSARDVDAGKMAPALIFDENMWSSSSPAERLSVAVTRDAPGPSAFHCHLLLHMEAGMSRLLEVSE